MEEAQFLHLFWTSRQKELFIMICLDPKEKYQKRSTIEQLWTLLEHPIWTFLDFFGFLRAFSSKEAFQREIKKFLIADLLKCQRKILKKINFLNNFGLFLNTLVELLWTTLGSCELSWENHEAFAFNFQIPLQIHYPSQRLPNQRSFRVQTVMKWKKSLKIYS